MDSLFPMITSSLCSKLDLERSVESVFMRTIPKFFIFAHPHPPGRLAQTIPAFLTPRHVIYAMSRPQESYCMPDPRMHHFRLSGKFADSEHFVRT